MKDIFYFKTHLSRGTYIVHIYSKEGKGRIELSTRSLQIIKLLMLRNDDGNTLISEPEEDMLSACSRREDRQEEDDFISDSN